MFNEDLLQEFIFDCKMRKLSERTIKGYYNSNLKMIHFIESEYGIMETEKTHFQAIRGYFQNMTEQKLSETYINRLIICAKVMFQYAVDEGYINSNPVLKIKHQKEPVTLIETFTNDEVKRLLRVYNGAKFLDIRNQLILAILFDTGVRNSELCNLKMDDLRDTCIKIMGKGKKVRYAPITPVVNKYLIRYKRVRDVYCKGKPTYETEYLLLSQKGRKLTVEALEHILRVAGEKANVRPNIRCSPHTCRHFFAQAQLKNGCDLYTLSKLLGHSKVDTTRRYLQSMHDVDIIEMGGKTSPLSNL